MKGDDAKFYASHDFAQFGVGISNYFKVNRVLQKNVEVACGEEGLGGSRGWQ